MKSTSVTQPQQPDTLSLIHEDMPVLDAGGKQVGKVSGLYLGAAADTVEQPGTTPETARGTAPDPDGTGTVLPVANFVEPFDSDDTLPAEMRSRLRYNGFVRIDAGGLHRNRYALREQIASVSADGVHLNVAGDALLKA
jgi:hypothetical protein